MSVKHDPGLQWKALEEKLESRFGKKPDMEAILFLVGIQETGLDSRSFTKEQKQDLMHVAVCSLLAPAGYYAFERKDQDGWPHFKQVKELPVLDAAGQENFLKQYILAYFETF
jgi:hypothetical protein